MKVLYIGSGNSAKLVNSIDTNNFHVVCANNAWRLFESSHFNTWLHTGDFPDENRPKTKMFDEEISCKEYSISANELVKKLNAKCKSPQHFLGYTVFFQGLQWIMNSHPKKDIYLLGFDHDYNPEKISKWNKHKRPGPNNNFYRKQDQSISNWSEEFFKNMENDCFYGHGTPDPMRLGIKYLKEKMQQALKHASILDINIYNLSPVESEFNEIIPKRKKV